MIENRNESKFLFKNNFLFNNEPVSDKYSNEFNYLNEKNNSQRQRSLPLKVIPNTRTQFITRSWTDNSFFQSDLNCFLLKYSNQSRSERCLDLIESSKDHNLHKTKITSVDTLSFTSSFISSIDFSKLNNKNKRNLPKFTKVMTDSSSEESLTDTTEKHSIEPDELLHFASDDFPSESVDSLQSVNQSEAFTQEVDNAENDPNQIIDKNLESEFIQISTDDNQLRLSETTPAVPSIYDNKVEESTINESNCSETSSNTLNESNSSSNILSYSSVASSTASSTENTYNSNEKLPEIKVRDANNEINETLSRDMFENDDSSDSALSGSEENFITSFLPKKSCLKKFFSELSDESALIESTANATSSPLASPRSTNSSLLWSSTTDGASSSQNQSYSSTSNTSLQRNKKRVSFADVCGKELFTVRTMSEPSNCPPKLTSKIVEYFLNREFNTNSATSDFYHPAVNSFQLPNNYITKCLQNRDSFFSTSRNYDYGINANYTNDVNQLKGSIAVYSLNFVQPAGEYFKFRKHLEDNSVSLENVLLNGFQINGTIKVKNLHFEKKVFLRCSFNNWKSYEDYDAAYVPSNYYSSASSLSSPNSSSLSAAFCGTNNSDYEPQHKEYDTFRFEFKLPAHVEREAMDKLSKFSSEDYKKNVTGSIQFCICYKSGSGASMKEYWDSNGGSNYEILQYVIDLERLKPSNRQKSTSMNKHYQKNKKNFFKYESNFSNSSNSNITNGPLADEIYY